MNAGRIHGISRRTVLALSFLVLLTVLPGYLQAPQTDEGTGAHIFQLTIVLLGPALLLFLVTADWLKPQTVARALAPAFLALLLAFAALYYLEHYWYAQARLPNLR